MTDCHYAHRHRTQIRRHRIALVAVGRLLRGDGVSSVEWYQAQVESLLRREAATEQRRVRQLPTWFQR